MDWLSIGLLFVVSCAAGGIGSLLGRFQLWRAVRQVRLGLADMEDRLISETRRRAARTRWDGEKDTMDELRQLYEQGPARAPAPEPWWRRHGIQARKVPPETGQERR